MKKTIFRFLFYRITAAMGLFCLIGAFSQVHAFWWLKDDDDDRAPVVEVRDDSHWYDRGNTEFPELPNQFSKIALLLPLDGKLGNSAHAIREGIITEYYAHQAQNSSTPPDVRIYDTQNDKAILSVYNQAVSDGAQLVIGPLTKQGIETLIDAQAITVPTLTLNYIENNNAPTYLFQFGLAPEDEVIQVAALAAAQGHRNAIVIAENTAWGKRVTNAFIQAWENNEGVVVDDLILSPQVRELAGPIQELLHIQPGTTPPKKIKPLESLEHLEPRYTEPDNYRRHDFDLIFLAVPSNVAQQIPPMLDFFYAGDVPIYAPANIYSGTPNPLADNDLNDVTFCDAPWVIDPQDRALGPNYASTLLDNGTLKKEQRFFALGLDAYRLAVDLAAVRPRTFSDNGATGTLQVNRLRQIVRAPQCAIFKKGVPRPLPPIDTLRRSRQNEYQD